MFSSNLDNFTCRRRAGIQRIYKPTILMVAVLLVVVPSDSRSVELEAHAANPSPKSRTVAVGEKGTVCAYSEVNGERNSKEAKPDTECRFKLLVKPPEKPAGLLRGVGTRDFDKDPPTTQTAISESEFDNTNARAFADLASFDSAPHDGTADMATLSAGSTITGAKNNPQTAARVVDPFLFPAGDHDYEIVIDAIRMTAIVGDGGAGTAYVGFSGASDVHGKLWDLALTLDTDGVLDLSFLSNAILELDDALVKSNFLAALDRSMPGKVELVGPYSLFASRLHSDVEFLLEQDLETGAHANAIPEPASGLLALLFSLGFVGSRALRQKPSWLLARSGVPFTPR